MAHQFDRPFKDTTVTFSTTNTLSARDFVVNNAHSSAACEQLCALSASCDGYLLARGATSVCIGLRDLGRASGAAFEVLEGVPTATSTRTLRNFIAKKKRHARMQERTA